MGLAQPAFSLQTSLVSAVVRHSDGDNVLVQCPQGSFRAARAAGCLLTPAVGDTVLLALLDDGEAWIVQVLRISADQRTLTLPPDTRLHARHLQVQTETTVLESGHLSLKALTLVLEGTLVQMTGRVCVQGFAHVRSWCRQLHENVRQFCGSYDSHRRTVEDLDAVQAGRIRLTSESSVRVRADHADIKADTFLDLDARHIKVG